MADSASAGIRVVEGEQPSGAVRPRQVSRQYTSSRAAESRVRFVAGDSKTTNRPSAPTDGEPLAASPNSPSGATETRIVDGLQVCFDCAAKHVSRRKICEMRVPLVTEDSVS